MLIFCANLKLKKWACLDLLLDMGFFSGQFFGHVTDRIKYRYRDGPPLEILSFNVSKTSEV